MTQPVTTTPDPRQRQPVAAQGTEAGRAHHGVLNLRRPQPVATGVDDVVHPPRDLVVAVPSSVSPVSCEVVAYTTVGDSAPAPNWGPAGLPSFCEGHPLGRRKRRSPPADAPPPMETPLRCC